MIGDVKHVKTVIEVTADTRGAQREIDRLAATEKKAAEARDKQARLAGAAIDNLGKQFGSLKSVVGGASSEIVSQITRIAGPAAIAATVIAKIG